jgi:hypothetical protein
LQLYDSATHRGLCLHACAQSRNDSISRWTPRMLPAVPRAAWRKSAQWVALTRPHAMRAVEDTAVNAAIRRYCRYGYDSYLRRCPAWPTLLMLRISAVLVLIFSLFFPFL